MEFLPGPEYLVNKLDPGTDPTEHADNDPQLADQTTYQNRHSLYQPQPYQLLPSDYTQYNLPPVPPPKAVAERQQWIIDTSVIHNKMLHKVWGAISKIRPCTCSSRPQVEENNDQEMINQQREMRSKEVEDVTESGDSHLSRRRKKAGQSQSQSSSESPSNHQ